VDIAEDVKKYVDPVWPESVPDPFESISTKLVSGLEKYLKSK
jgi:hypothetical protein